MPSPADRPPHILEQDYSASPLPPLNFSCQSGLEPGIIDLRWDDPSSLFQNSRFQIIGVNVYRTFDSPYGDFQKLNLAPICSNFWRDETNTVLVLEEDVSNSFLYKGTTDPDAQWVFQTRYKPILIQPWLGEADCASLNVYVTIDGVVAPIDSIDSSSGQVQIRNYGSFDPISQKTIDKIIPNDNSVVLATYRYKNNVIKTNMGQRVYYRLTSVCVDSNGNEIETSLNRSAVSNNYETEQLDWIWREAVRRNKFLLYQGGERVKVYIRKNFGVKCGCFSSTHKQPQSDCLLCYATGFIGGYDGPYDIIIAPDDSNKSHKLTNRGQTLSHEQDTWTSPSPLLSQRDFLVKLNGDRYSIGSVKMPTARGMQLQQFFAISHIDEQDIRSHVPIINTSRLYSPQTRFIVPGDGSSNPMVSERFAIPDEREFRGNTVTFENIYRR